MRTVARQLKATACVAFALVVSAEAQERFASSASVADNQLQTVVVTATRVSRSGYEPPTPTVVLGSDLLTLRTPGTLADALALLPVMRNAQTEGTGSLVFGVGVGRGFLNLRGLGPNRTLVLLDGERLVSNTLSAQPDVSLLPSALISRVEVVTGGASAAYGSDAVAGVVNFLVDSSFSGFKVDVSGGTSSHSDATEGKFSLTWGGDLRDQLHLIASTEYFHRDGLSPGSRDFATPTQTVSNLQYTPTNGQRPLLVSNTAYDANQSYGGLILNGPLAGQQFMTDGTTASYAPPSCPVRQPFLLCNSKQNLASTRLAIDLTAPQERANAFARMTWEPSERITANLDLLLARSQTSISTVPFNSRALNVFLPIDVAHNAFLPQAVRSQYLAAGITTLRVGRLNRDEGDFRETILEKTARIAAGLNVKLGGSWKLNALLSYSEARNDDRRVNDYRVDHFLNAVNSVIVNGTPVCAINAVSVVDSNCAPANIFGEGNMSAAAKAYFLGTVSKPLRTSEYTAALSVKGEAFSTWAGPVSVAVGTEYRRDAADQQTSDPHGLFAFSGQPAFSGSTQVGEAYVEAVAPLLEDAFLAKSVDLDAAARIADYRHLGTHPTWKLGFNYSPWSAVRLHAVASQDIRAPNIGELATPPFPSTITTLPNPPPAGVPLLNSLGYAPGQTVNVREIDSGNPNLKPEVAHALSFGAVLRSPERFGVTLSVDHYRIKIANAITTLTVPFVIQRCAAGDRDACALISFPLGSTLPVAQISQTNAQSFVTRGVDTEATWAVNALGGNVTLRALGNYLLEYRQVIAGAQAQDLRGDVGSGLPSLQGDIGIRYARGAITGLIDGVYIGAGDYNKLSGATIQNNHVPHVWYLGATLQYGVPLLGKDSVIYASVNNLLDQEPPHPGLGIYSSLNNSIFSGVPYDRIGRFFRLGFTANL
jgi:iron complex outermembrane receptor protein